MWCFEESRISQFAIRGSPHICIVIFCFAQTTLGGIEDLAKRKEDVRIANGLPASYEIQCPPQQAIVKERTPAPHTPPPTGTDSDSNGEIQWERGEEEPSYRPPKLRPKVR